MRRRTTVQEVVEQLDAIEASDDPESAHFEADRVLRNLVGDRVNEAYERVIERAGAWWYA